MVLNFLQDKIWKPFQVKILIWQSLITVGINPTPSHPELQNWAGGTLKSIKLIGIHSRFAKMAEKLNNFEKFERKKIRFQPLFSTQTPPNDWPDAIDHLTIGLVSNKYTKLEKTI